MTLARALSACTVAALAVGGALLIPSSASAAGVGDSSDAVLYGPSGPIGDVLTPVSDEDDAEQTVALPFALDFFGVESNALCITSNGVIAPVTTTSDTCGFDYDVDLEKYAIDNQVSVIGALLADHDPGETLWNSVSGSITSFSVSAGVGTFTTAEPHGLSVGDEVSIFTGQGSSLGEKQQVIETPTAINFIVEGLIFLPDIPETPLDGAVFGEAYTAGESDGFGETTSISFGETTVDGKPAVAVTWYRVPTNDQANLPTLSNTFQIVLVQEPTTDASNGYDFSIQYNFGTLTDAADGYEGGDPTRDCSSAEPETCRWSVGVARYDADSDTAEEYEFFADYPVTEIVDGGATPLVANSLNSDVLGRYILGMSGGEVVGFAVPELGAPGAAPAPAPAPALANTGSESALLIIPLAALALVLGAGLLMARRRTA